MGVLRLAVALLICIMHAKAQGLLPHGFLPHVSGLTFDPKLSIFFMMAGFFARQAVLGLQAKGGIVWPLRFYVSRMIRLWPVYWVCVFVTWVCVQMGMEVIPQRLMPGVPLWECVLYNLAPFIPASLKVGHLPVAWDSVIYVLLVFQAWTMALIMVLFALAPVLFFRGLVYPAFVVSCVGLWHAYVQQGQTQGYVIIALPYFLAGGIAFDMYARLKKPVAEVLGLVCWGLTGLLVLLLANHDYMVESYGPYAANFLAVLLCWAVMPVLFRMTRGNRFDVYMSNISYPLYLSHFLVFAGLKALGVEGDFAYGVVIPAILLVAVALHHGVEKPLMRFRRKGFVVGSSLAAP